MKFTITKKIIFSFILLLVTLSIIMGFYFIGHEKKALLSELDERAKALLESIAVSSEYPVLMKDAEVLSGMVRGTLNQKDVVFCKIEDIKGNVLFQGGTKKGRIREYTSPVLTKRIIKETDEELIYGVKIEETEKIGKVYLALSYSGLVAKSGELKKAIALMVTGAVIFTILLSVLLIEFLLGRNIRKLHNTTERFGEGDLSVRAEINSGDEMEELAGAFNGMANEIQRREEELKKYNETLEQKVIERTRELQGSIEQLKESQSRLIKKEKMAVVGQLSAKITHELRNILSNMNTVIYYLRTKLENIDKRYHSNILDIGKEIERMNKVITNVLGFSRPQELVLGKVDINKVLEEVLDQFKYAVGGELVKVEVTRKFSADIPEIPLDYFRMKQALNNLIINAFDVTLEGERVTVESNIAGGEVEIRVIDSGRGIEEGNLEKIFDAFFSTKTRGLGLGLAIVREIVNSHNGKIWVESTVGRGSSFIIRLPI